MFKPSPEETVLVAQILAQLQVKKKRCEEESVPVEDVFKLLQGAKLSDDILWHILSIADRNEKGKLERQDLGVAVRLIGWAQIGVEVSWDWTNRCTSCSSVTTLPCQPVLASQVVLLQSSVGSQFCVSRVIAAD